MLFLQNLSIFAQGNQILNSISCAFLPGSITYVIGPNGSGKTALLRSIAGIKKVTHGEIAYLGNAVQDIPKPYALYIGHKLGLDPELTVLAQLKLFARDSSTEMLIPAVIEYFRLQNILDAPISLLSAGYTKKIALTKCMLNNANLWLLDEVETNLDKENINLLHKMVISKADAGGIIFITSHVATTIQSAQKLNLENWIIKLDKEIINK